MGIHQHNLNSLRKKIRLLQKQNQALKAILDDYHIDYDVIDDTSINIEYIDDQEHLIQDVYISDKMAGLFLTLFQGRRDVYALRGAKGGYFPQCNNRWSHLCPKQNDKSFCCAKCSHQQMLPLTRKIGLNHLIGYKDNCTDVLGIYPLTSDHMCRFLVFDFDNHDGQNNIDYQEEVNALREICKQLDIDVLVERSRSGHGAHVWILLSEFVPATIVRTFGYLLLDKGMMSINLSSFQYYDRMFPSRDYCEGLGNAIALPLQGKALQKGNSAFVDENWNAYPRQWDVLLHTHRLSKSDIECYIETWKHDCFYKASYDRQQRLKPWRKDIVFQEEDVDEIISIILKNGIYIDTLNILPRLQNQIRSLAAFDNPQFYKNLKMGYSNWNLSSVIYMGEDMNDYIHIPRGLYDLLIEKCEESHISYEIEDDRQKGKVINVVFNGQLTSQQEVAAKNLLSYTDGVLNAATSFGKTVVGSYLISQLKTNTLVIVPRVSLCKQWIKELHHFLSIDEPLPTYKTKTGQIKSRKDVIGELHANKNTLTGIIDVVSIGSLYNKGKLNDFFNQYGMVIVDECHHSASSMYEQVLSHVDARYIYGFSSNDKRIDQMEKKVYMLIGPIRHKYTTRQRIEMQDIDHFVIPRFTPLIELGDVKKNLSQTYDYIVHNEYRNQMIIDDVQTSLKHHRTPLVLTKYKSHALYLYQVLKEEVCDHTYLIYGDNSFKQNNEVREQLLLMKNDEPYILVATGQSIGEGFNLPRLDTLFLAMPISNEPVVDQYIGRVHRDYPDKQSAIVYDYVDSHLSILNNMYKKRLRAYKKFGYSIMSDLTTQKATTSFIFNQDDYQKPFEIDIHNAKKRIVICSRTLSYNKLNHFIEIIQISQTQGVEMIVLTQNSEDPQYIYMLKSKGIYVELLDEICEQFGVIDDFIVWHGSMSLLGKEDVYDSLIRVESHKIAMELLNISFQNNE